LDVLPVVADGSSLRGANDVSTVTCYLEEIKGMLAERQFAGSPVAVSLCDQVREFTAAGPAA
jgi:hypothetical protein